MGNAPWFPLSISMCSAQYKVCKWKCSVRALGEKWWDHWQPTCKQISWLVKKEVEQKSGNHSSWVFAGQPLYHLTCWQLGALKMIQVCSVLLHSFQFPRIKRLKFLNAVGTWRAHYAWTKTNHSNCTNLMKIDSVIITTIKLCAWWASVYMWQILWRQKRWWGQSPSARI